MTLSDQEYSVDQEIADFFEKTSATRAACDARAKELVGGDVTPVAVQGTCSYSVYAGPNNDYVVQFRLRSLQLRIETTSRARDIYGSLAPEVSFHGQIGEDTEGKESLYIYVMCRVQGVSHLDFILARGQTENSPESFIWRKKLMLDIARFFALAWKAPQNVDQAYRDGLRHKYEKELELLSSSLPERFHPIIQHSFDSMSDILSLPMVLLHKDFGTCNIMVDSKSGYLVGVIDWAEAEIGPFGLNLHSLEPLMSKFHLRNGWIRYEDYETLQEIFWKTFYEEIGGLDKETIRAVKSARVLGLLLSSGFTGRLANMPEPVPIRDDESGAYNMRDLDGLLINPTTRFADLACLERVKYDREVVE